MAELSVERHDESSTTIGEYDGERFIVLARLRTFHHEAAGWADAIGEGAVVRRPREYNGCPCNRCVQGWTLLQGDHCDRELPGDLLL